jgi:uncharacterized protein (TIGR03382 family)
MKTSRCRWFGLGMALGILGLPASVRADFAPGDLLAGVEFLQEGGPGRVYRVNDGGDFTTTVPDLEMPIAAPVIDICSTDDGRVLAASSLNQVVYDITSGEAIEHATIPSDASALYCGEGKILVASFLLSAQVFDITQGGTVDEVYATGINRGIVRNVDGVLWGARFDLEAPGGGLFQGIEEGSDFTGASPYIELADVFATTVHDGRVFGIASFSEAVVDLSDGMPEFAHAIVPGARGITSSAGDLWVSGLEGTVYKTNSSLDYTAKPPFALLPGPSLSMAVVQKCGDGEVHGREQCDDAGASETCSATCTIVEAPAAGVGGGGAGGAPATGGGGGSSEGGSAAAGGSSSDSGGASSDDGGASSDDGGCSAAPIGQTTGAPLVLALALLAFVRRRRLP